MKTKEKENKVNEVETTIPTKKSKRTLVLDYSADSQEDIIRERAYTIYLNRGENPGSEYEDWQMAEKEIGLSVK